MHKEDLKNHHALLEYRCHSWPECWVKQPNLYPTHLLFIMNKIQSGPFLISFPKNEKYVYGPINLTHYNPFAYGSVMGHQILTDWQVK